MSDVQKTSLNANEFVMQRLPENGKGDGGQPQVRRRSNRCRGFTYTKRAEVDPQYWPAFIQQTMVFPKVAVVLRGLLSRKRMYMRILFTFFH